MKPLAYQYVTYSTPMSGHYQLVTIWMGDCLLPGKLFQYITNTKVNSAFHPSGVDKSSTGLPGWNKGGRV